jgi:hypothetical protein
MQKNWQITVLCNLNLVISKSFKLSASKIYLIFDILGKYVFLRKLKFNGSELVNIFWDNEFAFPTIQSVLKGTEAPNILLISSFISLYIFD